MKRLYLAITVAVLAFGAVRPSRADDAPAPPTKDQLDAAKKAFLDGKELHNQGKLVEAVDKFKESYRLSKNALLLYNIGLTLDEAGQKDNALLYYRKFLSDAPPTAAQRPSASDRVKALEKEKLDADLNGGGAKPAESPKEAAKDTSKDAIVLDTPEPKPVEPPKPTKATKIKPAGTYSASDFQHQIVDASPPGKPLDVTAFVPEDSGFVVTLYFRGKGDSTFTAKTMKWRYKELVARIPAAKMTSTTIQYYIEVKDKAGTPIARSGKSTDPNLVSIEAGAPTHYYTDLPDDAPAKTKHHEEEDPLAQKSSSEEPPASGSTPPSTGDETAGPSDTVQGDGFLDVGSKKFKYTKWGTTIGTGVLLLAGIAFYVDASGQASNLIKDQNHCGMPPCQVYDGYDQSVQSAGERFQTFSNISFVVGVGAAAVAGYYWYRELTSKKKPSDAGTTTKPAASTADPDMTWLVVPTIGAGGAGAAAMVRF